jgi:hypothetical protein
MANIDLAPRYGRTRAHEHLRIVLKPHLAFLADTSGLVERVQLPARKKVAHGNQPEIPYCFKTQNVVVCRDYGIGCY